MKYEKIKEDVYVRHLDIKKFILYILGTTYQDRKGALDLFKIVDWEGYTYLSRQLNIEDFSNEKSILRGIFSFLVSKSILESPNDWVDFQKTYSTTWDNLNEKFLLYMLDIPSISDSLVRKFKRVFKKSEEETLILIRRFFSNYPQFKPGPGYRNYPVKKYMINKLYTEASSYFRSLNDSALTSESLDLLDKESEVEKDLDLDDEYTSSKSLLDFYEDKDNWSKAVENLFRFSRELDSSSIKFPTFFFYRKFEGVSKVSLLNRSLKEKSSFNRFELGEDYLYGGLTTPQKEYKKKLFITRWNCFLEALAILNTSDSWDEKVAKMASKLIQENVRTKKDLARRILSESEISSPEKVSIFANKFLQFVMENLMFSEFLNKYHRIPKDYLENSLEQDSIDSLHNYIFLEKTLSPSDLELKRGLIGDSELRLLMEYLNIMELGDQNAVSMMVDGIKNSLHDMSSIDNSFYNFTSSVERSLGISDQESSSGSDELETLLAEIEVLDNLGDYQNILLGLNTDSRSNNPVQFLETLLLGIEYDKINEPGKFRKEIIPFNIELYLSLSELKAQVYIKNYLYLNRLLSSVSGFTREHRLNIYLIQKSLEDSIQILPENQVEQLDDYLVESSINQMAKITDNFKVSEDEEIVGCLVEKDDSMYPYIYSGSKFTYGGYLEAKGLGEFVIPEDSSSKEIILSPYTEEACYHTLASVDFENNIAVILPNNEKMLLKTFLASEYGISKGNADSLQFIFKYEEILKLQEDLDSDNIFLHVTPEYIYSSGFLLLMLEHIKLYLTLISSLRKSIQFKRVESLIPDSYQFTPFDRAFYGGLSLQLRDKEFSSILVKYKEVFSLYFKARIDLKNYITKLREEELKSSDRLRYFEELSKLFTQSRFYSAFENLEDTILKLLNMEEDISPIFSSFRSNHIIGEYGLLVNMSGDFARVSARINNTNQICFVTSNGYLVPKDLSRRELESYIPISYSDCYFKTSLLLGGGN